MKTLVLVGGGHAHLHCLEQFHNDSFTGWRIVLISSSAHQYYSGMFSGFTEGHYSLDEIRIDLDRLCKKIGAVFIKDQIVLIDAANKKLVGSSDAVYDYDLVSFDIGSVTKAPDEFDQQVSRVKPNFLFPDQLMRIRESAAPVIVGGGASGVELAFSVHAWRRKQKLPLNVVLLSSTPLLSKQGKRAAKTIEAIAKRKALPFFTGQRVEQMDDEKISTSTGQSFPQTDILWLTGPKSSWLFKNSQILTDKDGFLLVNDQLQSIEYPEIFGAGDCIAIETKLSIPKNGVNAVRQGPILWHNLKSRLATQKFKSFIPQKRFLSILSTGDGETFLTYGRILLHGKIPWMLKQAIDRQFMQRYKKLYE